MEARKCFGRHARGIWVALLYEVQEQAGDDSVNAKDVHDHLCTRAAEEPFVALVIIWLRFIEVIQSVYEAPRVGEAGNRDVFDQAVELGMTLLACTNVSFVEKSFSLLILIICTRLVFGLFGCFLINSHTPFSHTTLIDERRPTTTCKCFSHRDGLLLLPRPALKPY